MAAQVDGKEGEVARTKAYQDARAQPAVSVEDSQEQPLKFLVEQPHRRLQFVKHVGSQLELIRRVGAARAKQQVREFKVARCIHILKTTLLFPALPRVVGDAGLAEVAEDRMRQHVPDTRRPDAGSWIAVPHVSQQVARMLEILRMAALPQRLQTQPGAQQATADAGDVLGPPAVADRRGDAAERSDGNRQDVEPLGPDVVEVGELTGHLVSPLALAVEFRCQTADGAAGQHDPGQDELLLPQYGQLHRDIRTLALAVLQRHHLLQRRQNPDGVGRQQVAARVAREEFWCEACFHVFPWNKRGVVAIGQWRIAVTRLCSRRRDRQAGAARKEHHKEQAMETNHDARREAVDANGRWYQRHRDLEFCSDVRR